jgi:hypothetical protein
MDEREHLKQVGKFAQEAISYSPFNQWFEVSLDLSGNQETYFKKGVGFRNYLRRKDKLVR